MPTRNPAPSVHKIIVIPTTHWDRAWYWPFERFRVKLLRLFEVTKELWEKHPEYKFAIDGQTVPIEDYLEAVPQDRELLKAMGRAGRFTAGPLYVQPDLYCTGGEALIRNLLIGSNMAAEFNAEQGVFYLPDSFGHTPCIPMIAAGFEIDTYVFMRGLPSGFPDQQRFFRWRSADGSEVNVFRLRDGYANAARLGLHQGTGEIFDKKSSGIRPSFRMEPALKTFAEATDKQVDGQGAPYVLIAGVDHQVPQRELPEILARSESPARHYVIGDWNAVAAEIRQRDHADWLVHTGEFHADGSTTVLGGTISTRIHLKQDNANAERLLTDAAEPADAVVALLGIHDNAGAAIVPAWKRLLKAHPHDDITGCGVDTTHRETAMHIVCAAQAADAVRRRMAERLIEYYGGQAIGDERYAFFLYNTQAVKIQSRVHVQADFEGRYHWGDTKPPAHYAVVDEQGNAVPFRECSRSHGSEHPHPVLELELDVCLAPFTFQRFFLESRTTWPATCQNRMEMENQFLTVKVQTNGTVELLDKKTGRTWRGLGFFSDQADAGDEYDFSPLKDDAEMLFTNLQLERANLTGCSGLQIVSLTGSIHLPASVTGTNTRSTERVPVPVAIEYSLAPEDRHVHCRIKFTNTAMDHRLRWNLPVPFTPSASLAGLKFTTVSRPCAAPHANTNGCLVIPEHPSDHFVAVGDAAGGIALFSKFPINYEVVKTPTSRLAVTILRSVGFLSRGDLITRKGNAGPDTPTPEAQCLRTYEMEFAIRPFIADEQDGLFAESFRWRRIPVQGLILGCDPEPLSRSTVPLIKLTPGPVVVSALKISRDRKRVVLRLLNASSQPQTARVTFDRPRVVTPTKLHEKPVPDNVLMKRSETGFTTDMQPWSLATFLLSDAS